MAARDPDWDLGEVAAAHSLWVEQRGRLQRQAHRAKRLPPDVAPFVKAHDASLSPYKGAHIVTVLLDAEGPKLLFDGVELSGDGIVLPMPQTTPGAHGIYAPLAFTALVVGSGVPPDEVTVSFEQAGEVLERARLHAATDVDPVVLGELYLRMLRRRGTPEDALEIAKVQETLASDAERLPYREPVMTALRGLHTRAMQEAGTP